MAKAPVGLWVLGGGSVALAAAVAAWLAWRVQPEVPAPVATSLVPPQAAAPTPAPPSPAPPVAAEAAAPEPPSFDVVRVEAGGGALVAGRAAPGVEVVLSLDEVPVTRILADAAGQFVAIFDLGESAVPQVLTLAAVQGDGSLLAAPDVVVLAPRGGTGAAEGGDVPAPAEPVADAPASGPEEPPVAEEAVEPGATLTEAAPAAAAPPAAAPVAAADPAAVDTVAAAEPVPAPAPVGADPVPEAAVPEQVAQAPSTDAPEATPEAESAPPAAFVVEAGGGVRVLDLAPQVLDNVVIDAIGYGPEGDVQISGRTRQTESGTPLRVYLDNRPIAVARSEASDWRLDLPQVDPGVYTLRVDELAPDGRVVSRFETPFLREDPAAVARMFGTAPPQPGAAAEPPAAAGAQTAPEPAVETAALRPDTEPPPPSAPAAAPAAAPEPTAEPEQAAAAAPAPHPNAQAAPPAPRVMLVTVQPGHTLWRLSREHYGEGTRYLQIYRANRAQIRDPDLIYPGQIFAIPD